MRWAERIDDVRNKAEYYPNTAKRDLFKLGYIAARSGHSRGSTIDLTLVRRPDKTELDMGTRYDFADRQSWGADKTVSVEAQKNRAMFAAAMIRGRFQPYHKEWWHFTLANEPFPDTYFDFPVRIAHFRKSGHRVCPRSALNAAPATADLGRLSAEKI